MDVETEFLFSPWCTLYEYALKSIWCGRMIDLVVLLNIYLLAYLAALHIHMSGSIYS